MKILGIFLTFLGGSLILFSITTGIVGSYKLNRDYLSYWDLADKSSTIVDKANYIDKFVEAFEKENLGGKYNALIFKTPNNSFDSNFEALKSLQRRLHEIKNMDISSFEYQTAIQQITEQEQGEAEDMLSNLKGIWWKENYFYLWKTICLGQIIISLIIFCFGVCLLSGKY